MPDRGRYIELRTSDGKPIFGFYILERDITTDEHEKKVESIAQQNHHPRNGGGNGQGDGRQKHRSDKPPQSSTSTQTSTGQQQSLMTDAQKRFLFRILADRGIEGDQAHTHLKKLFGVELLKDVTKMEASRGIEKLLEQPQASFAEKGGNNNHDTDKPSF